MMLLASRAQLHYVLPFVARLLLLLLLCAVKIGRPGYRVTKQYDLETRQRSLLFQVRCWQLGCVMVQRPATAKQVQFCLQQYGAGDAPAGQQPPVHVLCLRCAQRGTVM
jgi:hypothetical protein